MFALIIKCEAHTVTVQMLSMIFLSTDDSLKQVSVPSSWCKGANMGKLVRSFDLQKRKHYCVFFLPSSTSLFEAVKGRSLAQQQHLRFNDSNFKMKNSVPSVIAAFNSRWNELYQVYKCEVP